MAKKKNFDGSIGGLLVGKKRNNPEQAVKELKQVNKMLETELKTGEKKDPTEPPVKKSDGRGRPKDTERNPKPVTFMLAENLHEKLHDVAYQKRKKDKKPVSLSQIVEGYIKDGLRRDGFI